MCRTLLMQTTNALKLRQSLGSILKKLAKNGEPIMVEKDHKPAAVLISIEDYQTRFVDRVADEKREQIVAAIRKNAVKIPKGQSTLNELRNLRS